MLWIFLAGLVYVVVVAYAANRGDKQEVVVGFELSSDCSISKADTDKALALTTENQALLKKYHRIKKADKGLWLSQNISNADNQHKFLVAYDAFKEELKSEREFNKWINS